MLSKSQKRIFLRDFRHHVIEKIKASGLTLIEEETKTRDEGNYLQLSLVYPSQYIKNAILRPHLQIEMMVNQSKLTVNTHSVTTLIRHILGEQIEHPKKWVSCVSVTETAAEKWVALTRRVANAIKRPEVFLDPTLVRHIYDLHNIYLQNQLDEPFYSLIEQLITEDSKKYKNQNPDYVRDPLTEIRLALSTLHQNTEWERRWEDFMGGMVYGENKPNYSSALASLNILSTQVLEQLEIFLQPQ
ncbi:MAG: nucleotidyl transferase AbiEii/AbiGii toxin family protein [Gammaproteobacteria bacterium]|nr:nucleotidyl transferase AbiEii/AbiGii toxin family protein [Gammaproteobacteria bacterium]